MFSARQTPLNRTAHALALAALFILPQHRTSAEIMTALGTGSVVRVEEDWVLVIGLPDANVSSPQVSTQMAASPDATRFSNFHLNSQDVPNFSQGGLQLQVWKGGTNLAFQNSTVSTLLNTPNEVITWTQYLRSSDDHLHFGISAASSFTWGNFSSIEVRIPDSENSLDNYSADYSQQNSGITYGATRVTSLTLTATRKFLSNGLVLTDRTARAVYSPPSP